MYGHGMTSPLNFLFGRHIILLLACESRTKCTRWRAMDCNYEDARSPMSFRIPQMDSRLLGPVTTNSLDNAYSLAYNGLVCARSLRSPAELIVRFEVAFCSTSRLKLAIRIPMKTVGILLILLMLTAVPGSYAGGLQAEPAAVPATGAAQRAVLNKYCVTCHNEKVKTAGLLLDQADVDQVTANPELWEKVTRKLRTGAMPPAGLPRPDKPTYNAFATYLETSLDSAAEAHPNPGRTASVHRLNRSEYSNAVRDLLAVEIDGTALLPPDDGGKGFDNLAELLTVSPVLMEQYMSVAARIADLAVGDPTLRATAETYQVPPRLVQDDRVSDDLPFGTRGGIAVKHAFPLDGEYNIKIRLVRNGDEYIRGLLGQPHPLEVRIDGAKLKTFRVGGEDHGATGPIHSRNGQYYESDPDQTIYEYYGDDKLQLRVPVTAGAHLVQIAFLKMTAEPEGIRELSPRPVAADYEDYKGGLPGVDRLTITGPFNAKGPGNSPSRQRIFVCQPAQGASTTAEEACARQIVTNLARRAYRRPLQDKDIQSLLNLYRKAREDRGFEAGIEMAVRRILAGPEFLFRVERDPASAAPSSVFSISDVELASRISFFLWSSIPDDTLLDLAEKNKLHEPATLEQQVQRMLADQRSDMLVNNFAGQWLVLRNLRAAAPDPRSFPEFDEELRMAFERESTLFFESMLREDRSVLELLNADYTFVNQRLAEHYGIPKVYGSSFRRVAVTDENRRGLLGQGSILTVTSMANRTSPVLRGKWVLENLLGAPPPPPPPNVPALPESKDMQNLSMRKRMEQHRANPACAACHTRMDPIGLALDNFDAVGRWRAAVGGVPLDTAGVLFDGTKFSGPTELRNILVSRPDQFATTVTEKLFTYALGRELDYNDAPTVRKLVREAAKSNYRWSSLILGIIKSAPFQMRRTKSS
ncbi:MAG: DUF1592 domain-containing protein [Acidobacteria bacterium]|nr:DUF1592 domain-containing protein [Acidobacteriota bacterium]